MKCLTFITLQTERNKTFGRNLVYNKITFLIIYNIIKAEYVIDLYFKKQWIIFIEINKAIWIQLF